MMPDDATLLRRYAETGAQDAFAEIVRRHLDGVFSAAVRRVGGDAHLAEDVAQEVFVALARKASLVARRPVLASWLYTATRHQAANVVRSERRRKARETEAQSMHANSANSEPPPDWERLAPVLDQAIDELGEKDRSAILLRFVDRRAFAQIGATLRMTEDAARLRVEKALEKLRAGLERHGIASTGTALATTLTGHSVLAAPAGLAASIAGTATTVTIAVGPLAGIFTFMTASKISGTVASVALMAASVGLATWELTGRRTAEKSLLAAIAVTTQLEGRLRELQRAADAETTLSAAKAELARTDAASASPSARVANIPADPVKAGNEFLAKHPEAQSLWDEMRRASFGGMLLPRYAVLGLTTVQRNQLEDLMILTSGGLTTLNVPGGKLTLQRQKSISNDEMLKQTRVMLGDESYERFMALRKLDWGINLTTELASTLYRAEPLSPPQVELMWNTAR